MRDLVFWVVEQPQGKILGLFTNEKRAQEFISTLPPGHSCTYRPAKQFEILRPARKNGL